MGITVGRYQVIEELGRGGMGVVYRAEDTMLGRQLALKILPPKQLSEALIERFKREARACARLDSPFIVKIYDFAMQHDGNHEIWYFAMELVEGHTLGEVIRQRPLPDRKLMSQRLQLFWQILHAMSYAHELGVVHRDLKPDNVMVNDSGQIKIMDFGLAFFDGHHSQTQANQVMGTFAYFAPEQAKSSADVDQRADIYSLGVILFELLTGELPIIADHPLDMLRKLVSEPPRSAIQLNPLISPELEAFVFKALMKEPADRFPSTTVMKQELEALLMNQMSVKVEQLDPYRMPSFPEMVASPEPPPEAPQPAPEPEEVAPPPVPQTRVEPPNPFDQTRLDVPGQETGESQAGPAPKPAERQPKKPYFQPLNPGIASDDWLEGAEDDRPKANDWQANKVKRDDELQKKLTPPAPEGPRVVCRHCHESNPPVSHCQVCGKELEATVYRDRRKAKMHFETGRKALAGNYLDEAVFEFEQAIEKDPDFAEAYMMLGRALMEAHEFEDAQDALNEAVERLDDPSPALLILADLFQRHHDTEEVIAILVEIINIRPSDHSTRSRLAFLYQETGRIQEAMRQYRAVLRYQPEDPTANRQLGLLLAAEDRIDEAIHYLEITCRLDPRDSHSCALLGRLYARVRRYSAAEDAIVAALERDGDEASLRAELGALYQAQGRFDLAAEEYRRALEIDQGQREARLHLADIYKAHGQPDRALMELREAMSYHPQDISVHRKLGDAFLQVNDLERAMEHFEKVVQLDPNCARMRNRLGQIYLKKNYDQLSIDQFTEAVKLHPVEPEYREDLGMAYYCAGDLPRAASELHKAATLDGHNADYFKALGILYYEMQQDEEAVRHLKWSLHLSPNDAQGRGLLGQALARQGLANMAITEFERALELDPSLHLLHLYLARAAAQAGKHARAIEAFNAFGSLLESAEDEAFLGHAYVEMGLSYLADRQYARAGEVFGAALARNPQDAYALVGLGRVAMARQEFEEADREFQKALVMEPRNPRVLEAIADLAGERNDWNKAALALQKALAESPATVALHEKLGRSLRKAGRSDEARAVFQRAAQAFPRNRGNFYWLEGRVLGRQGQWGEAAHLFRRALDEAPGNWKVLEDLAEACHRLGETDEAIQAIEMAMETAPESRLKALETKRANL